MDMSTRLQILDEAVYNSQSANTFWKGMNQSVLASAKSQYKDKLDSLTLVW